MSCTPAQAEHNKKKEKKKETEEAKDDFAQDRTGDVLRVKQMP